MCQTEREIRAKAPKRPYRNFVEFCLCRTYSANRLTPGRPFYPCLTCGGRGRNYDPEDPPDPVEGNKHRHTLECKGCKGSGESDRKTCFAAYSQILNKWHVEIALFQAHVKRRLNALAKLTEDEIKALNELGI